MVIETVSRRRYLVSRERPQPHQPRLLPPEICLGDICAFRTTDAKGDPKVAFYLCSQVGISAEGFACVKHRRISPGKFGALGTTDSEGDIEILYHMSHQLGISSDEGFARSNVANVELSDVVVA